MWIIIILVLWVIISVSIYIFDDFADSSCIPLAFLLSLMLSLLLAMIVEGICPNSVRIAKININKVKEVNVENNRFVVITDDFRIVDVDKIIKSDKNEIKTITKTQTGAWNYLVMDEVEVIYYGDIK